MLPSRLARPGVVVVAAVAIVATLAACSSSATTAGGSATTTTAASGGAAPATLRTVAITLTADGCVADHDSYSSGPLTFDVANTDATAVSEFEILSEDRILGEKENLAPGFKGSFSIVLQPGTYTMYCPGATKEKAPFTVTGTATTQPATTTGALLKAGATQYLGYVTIQVDSLLQGVTPLVAAIKSGNLAAAQTAYAKARAPYERIEPVAESFGTLDAAIDERADDVKPTAITGFHRLEYGLFSVKSLTGLTPIAEQLLANVTKLKSLVAKLTGFQPAELANGAVGLLDEAAKSKITGEEERYSHIDLLDFSANVEGAEQAFAFLEDGLSKIDATLVSTIRAAFTKVEALLDHLRDPAQASGFTLYNDIPKADITELAQALQAVAEPLSRVAGKVVSA